MLYGNLSFSDYRTTTHQSSLLDFLGKYPLHESLSKSLSIKLGPDSLTVNPIPNFFPLFCHSFPQLGSLESDQYCKISSLPKWPDVQPLQVKRPALTNCFARQAELNNLIRGFISLQEVYLDLQQDWNIQVDIGTYRIDRSDIPSILDSQKSTLQILYISRIHFPTLTFTFQDTLDFRKLSRLCIVWVCHYYLLNPESNVASLNRTLPASLEILEVYFDNLAQRCFLDRVNNVASWV